MAFTTRRGRPAKSPETHDYGTPELRFKHAHGLTAEPIDVCLERDLISRAQHRSGLHLRWLYTLRYGAPSLTTRYADASCRDGPADDGQWRSLREREYHEASRLLKAHRCYEPVMRLAVFNETPSFLSVGLRARCWEDARIAAQINHAHQQLTQGLELLTTLWRKEASTPATGVQHTGMFY
ncbi:MAG: hypothetical protein ACKVOE_03785 [Rickettsiales bacterium]